jgi:hypothetical protein
MGRPSYGPAISVSLNSRENRAVGGRQRRVTNDANSLAEALPGMTEIARYPNRGAYSLLYDTATDEFVLFNIPVTSPTSGPPPGWKRDDSSPIRANPTGGPNERWAPLGMARESGTSLVGADSYGAKPPAERRPGTLDAALHARALRLVNAERVRGVNDANRARFGQPPLTGRPGHGAI